MIEEGMLRSWLEEGKTIWQIMTIVGCSTNTVCKYMKRYQIPTPKGFFNREGRKPGRPPGFKHTPEEIEFMRERMTGEGNPFFGKTHDAITKAKMRGPRPQISGDQNPFRKSILSSDERRDAHRERVRHRWASYSEEQKAQIITRFSKAQAQNKYHHTHASFKKHINGFYDSSKAGTVFYRSNWELIVFQTLDSLPYVNFYQVEPFMVPYHDHQGNLRYTRPDLLVVFLSGYQLLAEIKPETLLDFYNNREKIAGQRAYARDHGLQFAWIQRNHIHSPDSLNALFTDADQGKLYVNETNR